MLGLEQDRKIKFTILVMTYNSDLYKLYLTLQSVFLQKFDGIQIVITDDGSKENHFKEIEEYFYKNHFKEYKLVGNKENKGTVQNLISGLKHVDGKYVKFISAGDTLFSESTVKRVYQYMEHIHSSVCFGLLQGYNGSKTEIKYIPFQHPFDIEVYRKKNDKKILRNLVLYSDNVCGAAICYRTDCAKNYMKKISKQVVYEEDIFQVLAAAEGTTLDLYDDYMIWYEVGTGVSTGKQSKFQEALKKDTENFYKKLYDLYPANKYIAKRFRLMKYYKINNLYLRTLLRIVENPHLVVYLMNSFLQRIRGAHKRKSIEKGFLAEKEFWRKV